MMQIVRATRYLYLVLASLGLTACGGTIKPEPIVEYRTITLLSLPDRPAELSRVYRLPPPPRPEQYNSQAPDHVALNIYDAQINAIARSCTYQAYQMNLWWDRQAAEIVRQNDTVQAIVRAEKK